MRIELWDATAPCIQQKNRAYETGARAPVGWRRFREVGRNDWLRPIQEKILHIGLGREIPAAGGRMFQDSREKVAYGCIQEKILHIEVRTGNRAGSPATGPAHLSIGRLHKKVG